MAGANISVMLLFSFFSNTNCTEKTVGFSRIRTQSIRVEGKHADHHHGPTSVRYLGHASHTITRSVAFGTTGFNKWGWLDPFRRLHM